ncbi:hypothetical protein BGP75_08180 [Motiliproteus sp. MSK22-1]|nr:hypothetical protein BGP75_08180 [Motiliproteus sp. MSK22-1]
MTIEKLGHDGRGLCRHNGKILFVSGALPGERVRVSYLNRRAKYDEARCLEVLDASEQRRSPRCRHFNQCGGCELQHLSSEAQIDAKQQQALDQLRRLGGLAPENILSPLDLNHWQYRRRARLGVLTGKNKATPVIGFRRKQSKQLIPIKECPILEHRAEQLLKDLSSSIIQSEKPQSISHIELALGDEDAAIVLRHPRPLASNDLKAFDQLARRQNTQLYLQPGDIDSIYRHGEGQERLYYNLHLPRHVGSAENIQENQDNRDQPEKSLVLGYHPSDFTQVNAAINQKMVTQALELLEPNNQDRILDLFCGLGNFTLPLATLAAEVVGVEGSEKMVARGTENAKLNDISNARFYCADLTRDISQKPWFKNQSDQRFNKILLDPPRAGALEVIQQLKQYTSETLSTTVLYISCDPATLARDAAELVKQGYRLEKWGVMNMFPQTTHVESIALFTR